MKQKLIIAISTLVLLTGASVPIISGLKPTDVKEVDNVVIVEPIKPVEPEIVEPEVTETVADPIIEPTIEKIEVVTTPAPYFDAAKYEKYMLTLVLFRNPLVRPFIDKTLRAKYPERFMSDQIDETFTYLINRYSNISPADLVKDYTSFSW